MTSSTYTDKACSTVAEHEMQRARSTSKWSARDICRDTGVAAVCRTIWRRAWSFRVWREPRNTWDWAGGKKWEMIKTKYLQKIYAFDVDEKHCDLPHFRKNTILKKI